MYSEGFPNGGSLSPAHMLRLSRGPDDNKNSRLYVERAKRSLVLEAAANAWSQGVPWAEALSIATRAIEQGNPRPKAVAKAKAKGPPFAKRKATAKAQA